MPDDPETTTNFDFPLMSENDEDYEGIWGEVLDTGGETDNDGLIEPLAEILGDAYLEVDDGDTELTLENADGDTLEFLAED